MSEAFGVNVFMACEAPMWMGDWAMLPAAFRPVNPANPILARTQDGGEPEQEYNVSPPQIEGRGAMKEPSQRPSSVIAVASSAGGLKALTRLLADLPADLPAAIVIVQHLAPQHESKLAEILSRRCALRVVEAVEGMKLRKGLVATAPPDCHLLIDAEGTLSLSKADAVRFVRPSADVLFASVAAAFGTNAIAVVLTGTGSDGAAGSGAIKRAGGTVIVSDRATSEFFGMPNAAIATGHVDEILPLEQIAARLDALTRRSIGVA